MTAQHIVTHAACCGLFMIQTALAGSSAAAADSAAAQPLDAPQEHAPTFEAAVDFSSRQLTYGLVDNRDPILTLEVLAEWHGFNFWAGAILDTTAWGRKHGGYGNRKGTYQEFAFGPGYVCAFSPDDYARLPTTLELFVNYIYEYHPPVNRWKGEDNPDTQFINVGAALPDLWLAPALSAEFDIDNEYGAMYLAAEIGHTFTLVQAAGNREADLLSLSVGGGVGFGNPRRNRHDTGFDTYAFKDVWASAALEWQLTDHIVLSPYVALFEQVHGRLRDAARRYIEGETHASTQLVGGLRVAATF